MIEYPYAHTFPLVHDIFLKPFGFQIKVTYLFLSYIMINDKRISLCLAQLTSSPLVLSLEVMNMSPSQASASPSAIAKPIPRFEPVTTATFKTNRVHNNFLIFTEYFSYFNLNMYF